MVEFLNVLSTCRDYGLGKPSTITEEWKAFSGISRVSKHPSLSRVVTVTETGRLGPRFRIGPYPEGVGSVPKLGSGRERSGEHDLGSML